jgi:catechol 2,3-dioxygenase-like lactoylglutathione lyase family enzyme
MITRLSHATIYVLNQDDAYDFYINKLGFKVHTDAKMEGFRWLTVTAPENPGFEIILMPIMAGFMMSEDEASKLRELVKAGKMGTGVFETNDCRATYEELKAKGVEFINPPEEKFYGIEAVMKDNSGNWFSLTERPKQK